MRQVGAAAIAIGLAIGAGAAAPTPACAWPHALRDSQDDRVLAARPVVAPARRPLRVARAEPRPFVIGVVLAQSGPWAGIGAEIASGIAVAVEHAGGQAAGRPLRLVFADSRGRPRHAVDAARKLVAENAAELLIGPVTSPEALELRDFVHERQVPLVMPGAGADAVTGEKCDPFVVRVSYANDQIVRPLGAWAASRKAVRRVYMIAAENISGRDMLADFGRTFVAGGGEIVGQILVPDGVADFTPHLAKLRLTGADGVFAFLMDDAARSFVASWNGMGLGASLRLLAPGVLLSPVEPSVRPPGAVGAVHYLPDTEAGANPAFVQDFATRHGHLPSEWAAQGYDAIRLVVEALGALGGRSDDRAALARSLGEARFAGARGRLRIDPRTNNVVQDVFIVEARPAGGGGGYAVLDRLPEVAADPAACKALAGVARRQ